MDARFVLLLALAIAAPSQAQQVFKCVAGKQVTYQSEPCLPGQAVKAWDAKPEQVDYANQARLDAIRRQLRAANSVPAYYTQRQATGAAIGMSRDQRRCENAKRERQRALDAVGHRRTFEMSRRLDDMVYDACK
ncbi:hypothetical protein FHY11_001183 [Xanthomonas arboricola]|uniref:DUF4124 domain-containing protein n=1 Tax=Xanthomonas euroxanthea TaxID=2259622 RepID=UPI00141AA527|nr:DUF4124 domain-containing protein [Xanthomonas euroxanthea]NIK07717.1 hypothetical protein [Xanthomonas euroxanthea]